MADLLIASDENEKQIPNVELANRIYVVEQKRKQKLDTGDLLKSILEDIKSDEMADVYVQIIDKFDLTKDEELVATMMASNKTVIEEIETKIADAIQNAGDTEVIDGMFTKARHFSKVGSWSSAMSAYDDILNRPKLSSGKKIDATMEKARIAIFLLDFKLMKGLISDAKKLIDAGGDWDRRNRLKVYEALYLLSTRDLLTASGLLLDCVATFTCVELCSYQKFMSYAVLTNALHLPRVQLKKKLITNPHVISVLREVPNVASLMQNLYGCDYSGFFKALLAVYEEICDDRYLGPHATYLVRECRLLAYSQFLEAYRSVTLSSMADTFGISVGLLDDELSRFISAGRLNAKVDKVGDIIETSRPDQKNVQYQEVIKKGDVLLNQIQKLVRVVDI